MKKTAAISPIALYFTSFLIALHLGITLYINSSYLSTFIAEKYVGIVYTTGSIGLLLILAFFRRVVGTLGNLNTMRLLMIAQGIALALLLFDNTPMIVIPAMLLHIMLGSLMIFSMDIFLENQSQDAVTGSIRGRYLFALNVGVFISPFLFGLMLTNHDFWKVYIISMAVLAVAFLLVNTTFKRFRDPAYEHVSLSEAIRETRKKRNLYRICASSFFLYFFYATMVVYMPIYLSEHIGFSWNAIGQMFTFMLIPFLLFDMPLGKLADIRGEKTILSIGYVVTALTTAGIAFITSTSFFVWAIALFLTRVGISTIEIMNETYFFKQINSKDAHIITLYRMAHPLAYITAPLVATIIYSAIGFKFIFLVLGIIMMSGLYFSSRLKDT